MLPVQGFLRVLKGRGRSCVLQCNKQQKIILQQLQLGLVPYIEAVNLFHLRNDREMVEEMDLLCPS